jgi:hypothetical protein
MTTVATFAARVTEDGILTFLHERKLLPFLREMAGRFVNVTIGLPTDQRTSAQNRYLHAEPFRKIAEHTGASVAQVKLDLMGECWGWTESKLTGHLVPVKPSTAKMTKKDATLFIDWLLPWALEFFNGAVDILPPQQWYDLHPEVTTDADEED